MDRKCIIACFSNENELRPLLKRLMEMGIEINDISMVAIFDKLEHLYGTILGPLKGADLDNLGKKISHLGFRIDLARSIKSYLTDGGAIAVVACEDYQIENILELLSEFNATIVELSE